MLKNRDIQKEHYLRSIRWYLKHTGLPIVIVDNSKFDFSPFFTQEIRCGRLECITFDGNNYNVNLGKGFGEGEIMIYLLHWYISLSPNCFEGAIFYEVFLHSKTRTHFYGD